MKSAVIVTTAAVLALSGCGSQETSAPTVTETSSPSAATPPASNAIQIEEYNFRISNSVEGKQAHIDLYLTRGSASEHVPGANIELTLTAPDGHTETVNMTEDAPNKHYAGTATMDHQGEYLIAARTSINGKTFTPRFTITNTQ